jgi:hypothetical protein
MDVWLSGACFYYAEDGEKPEIRILQSHRYMVKMAVKRIREMMASEGGA